MAYKNMLFMAAVAMLTGSAQAAVITFNNLQPDPGQFYGTFTSTTENGYTATNRGGFNGSFYNGYQFSTQTPEIAGIVGTVSVTGSGLFSLGSFDAFFGGSDPSSSYTVSGYVGGVNLYTASGSIAKGPTAISTNPLTTYSGFSSALFDRIDIAISGNGNTYLDNITVNPAVAGAVPEPASWTMMVGGFGLIGTALRRRSVAVAYA